ncbi:hypothetical protein [Helicobacter sp. MIT 05-5294]|nr:hypothetical protein [Helicobacter sp. MIT 05-5294]
MKLESLQLMQMQLEWIGVGYCLAILPPSVYWFKFYIFLFDYF